MLREAAGPEALLVVEKILEGDETLRDWPVDGTTGYERLNDINGLFIEEAGYQRLDAHLIERGLLAGDAHARLIAAKRQVLDEMFGSEVARLARLAAATLADEDFRRTRSPPRSRPWPSIHRSIAAMRASAGMRPMTRRSGTRWRPTSPPASRRAVAAAAGALLDAIRVGDALALGDGPAATGRACHGEGPGRHGVLPQRRAALGQRGRRRPVAAGNGHRAFPCPQRRRLGSPRPRPARHPRHQARRRRPGPPQPARRRSRCHDRADGSPVRPRRRPAARTGRA